MKRTLVVLIFYIFSGFSFLTSMDLPQKKEELSAALIQKDWKQDTTYEAFRRLQDTGGIFACFPLETLSLALPTYSADEKNSLLQTNKGFNILVSRENPQPFMFCKALYACQADKLGLGIEMLYSINQKNKQQILDAFYATNFKDNSWETKEEYTRRIRFDCSDRTNPQFNLVTTMGNTIDIKSINPDIIPFLTRNIEIITNHCNRKKINLNDSEIDLVSSFLVEHNDVNSFELLRTQAIYKKCSKMFLAPKLLQIAFFYANEKVIPTLMRLYQGAKAENIVAVNIGKDKDYFGIFFNQKPIEAQSFASLIQIYHPKLVKKHNNHLDRYYACLRQIWKEKDLVKFNPPVPAIQKQEKNSAKKEKKSKKSKYRFWK